jgi:hypothetical protein
MGAEQMRTKLSKIGERRAFPGHRTTLRAVPGLEPT